MELNNDGKHKRKVYYFYGSGLFPVAEERVNEMEKLRAEYHRREADFAMLAAGNRKVA